MVFFENFIILHNYQNETANPFHVKVTVSLVSTEKSSGSVHSQGCKGCTHTTAQNLCDPLTNASALPGSLLLATKIHFITCKMSLQLYQRKLSAFNA